MPHWDVLSSTKVPVSIPHALGHLRRVQSRATHRRAEVPPSLSEWQQGARVTMTAAVHCLCVCKGRARVSQQPCQSPDISVCDFRNNPHHPNEIYLTCLCRFTANALVCYVTLPCLYGLSLLLHSTKEACPWSISPVQSERVLQA